MFSRVFVTALLVFVVSGINAQDSFCIKVHFLYGSAPLKTYRKTEPTWFGGILGGHVGLEADSNRVLNFVPNGKFHLLPAQRKHSRYTVDSVKQFYSRLGGQDPDSAKQAIVIIPVSRHQKQLFDSIAASYMRQTPYDYALAGMRCGAATYEILAQLGIMKPLGLPGTAFKILYPKKLRQRLLAKAEKNGWTVIRHNGSSRRKWETD